MPINASAEETESAGRQFTFDCRFGPQWNSSVGGSARPDAPPACPDGWRANREHHGWAEHRAIIAALRACDIERAAGWSNRTSGRQGTGCWKLSEKTGAVSGHAESPFFLSDAGRAGRFGLVSRGGACQAAPIPTPEGLQPVVGSLIGRSRTNEGPAGRGSSWPCRCAPADLVHLKYCDPGMGQ